MPLQVIDLAQAGADTTTVFVQYGALGVIALLALGAVRVLFQREVKALDLERQRADRLEDELRRLNATVQERYMSTLTEATRVMGDVLDAQRAKPR
jgi:16S rRNA C967 or C1407 C5-methylase (RsmB/RsmF family)